MIDNYALDAVLYLLDTKTYKGVPLNDSQMKVLQSAAKLLPIVKRRKQIDVLNMVVKKLEQQMNIQ